MIINGALNQWNQNKTRSIYEKQTPIDRMWSYLNQVIGDYSFGKTIRINQLGDWLLDKCKFNRKEAAHICPGIKIPSDSSIHACPSLYPGFKSLLYTSFYLIRFMLSQSLHGWWRRFGRCRVSRLLPEPARTSEAFFKGVLAKYTVFACNLQAKSLGETFFNDGAKACPGKVLAAACIPTGHTFLSGTAEFESKDLLPVLDKMKNPQPVQIPKSKKDLFADFFPALRGRLDVRLIRKEDCSCCNTCGANSPMGAMKNGKSNSRYIRCLRCVACCPQNALRFENSGV